MNAGFQPPTVRVHFHKLPNTFIFFSKLPDGVSWFLSEILGFLLRRKLGGKWMIQSWCIIFQIGKTTNYSKPSRFRKYNSNLHRFYMISEWSPNGSKMMSSKILDSSKCYCPRRFHFDNGNWKKRPWWFPRLVHPSVLPKGLVASASRFNQPSWAKRNHSENWI